MKKAYKIASAVMFLFFIAIAGIIHYAYKDYLLYLSTPIAPEGKEIRLHVPSGSGFHHLLQKLEKQNWNINRHYFRWYERQEKFAAQLKAGHYVFDQSPTPAELVDTLVKGKVEQHKLTIVEGWSYRQMLDAIKQHPMIKQTLPDYQAQTIIEAIQMKESHPEGMFYPDTYLFPAGMTDTMFLHRAYQTMHQRLKTAWDKRSPEAVVKSPYETLILASIVEKETGAAHERPEIAGVFTRRIHKRMRLQTDPTVIYGMGDKFDGNIRRKDLKTDTPYNTYTRFGLPPTPIALPGQAAIDAALNPKEGDTLYFVSRGDGTHYFSATLEEHNRAVRKYQLGKP